MTELKRRRKSSQYEEVPPPPSKFKDTIAKMIREKRIPKELEESLRWLNTKDRISKFMIAMGVDAFMLVAEENLSDKVYREIVAYLERVAADKIAKLENDAYDSYDDDSYDNVRDMLREMEIKREKVPRTGGIREDDRKQKSPHTAYMYFAQEKRKDIVRENPGISFGDIGNMLAGKWRRMSDEKRAKFKEMEIREKLMSPFERRILDMIMSELKNQYEVFNPYAGFCLFDLIREYDSIVTPEIEEKLFFESDKKYPGPNWRPVEDSDSEEEDLVSFIDYTSWVPKKLKQKFEYFVDEYNVIDDVDGFIKSIMSIIWDRHLNRNMYAVKRDARKSSKKSKSKRLGQHAIRDNKEWIGLIGAIEDFISRRGIDAFVNVLEEGLPKHVYRDILENLEREIAETIYRMPKIERLKFFKAIDLEDIEQMEEYKHLESKRKALEKKSSVMADELARNIIRHFVRNEIEYKKSDVKKLSVEFLPLVEEARTLIPRRRNPADIEWIPYAIRNKLTGLLEKYNLSIPNSETFWHDVL